MLCDGIACGYLCVEERVHDIHVREIVLLPGFQGRGIGSLLLREVMERARKRGVPVKLATFLENRAFHLHQRLGFQEIGRTDTQFLMEWKGEEEGPTVRA